MSTTTFTKGARLWIDGRAATVLASETPNSALVAFDGADAPETLDLLARYADGAVQWFAPAAAPTPTPAALEQIPETAWNEALRS